MSTHIDDDNFEQLVDTALRSPEITLLLRTQLRPRPGVPTPAAVRTHARAVVLRNAVPLNTVDVAVAVRYAVTEIVLPHTAAYADVMATLAAPATRRLVARKVPASEVDDVLADARARVWTALRHTLPERGGAFAMAIVKIATADWGRRDGRRPRIVPLTAPDGTVADVADVAGERALNRLVEVDTLHGLLVALKDHGATPLELQRLMAFVLADGNATAAVALLPTRCRAATLNQSITSLRNRL